MKNKYTENNYGISTRNMQLKFDEIVAERLIPGNDSVRLLDQTIDGLDLSSLLRATKRSRRSDMASPATMLKLLVYAAMEHRYASRPIHEACLRDINYIWLLNGEPAPSYRSICRFRSEVLSECAEDIFYQLVEELSVLGEICFGHLFVDGTKLEANANKYSFVWKKSTNKYEARVFTRLESLVNELKKQYKVTVETPEKLLRYLLSIFKGEFVSGRGHRKTQLQRDIEALRKLLEKKARYAAYQATFGDRNSFSKTDPDATFMHMKDDHMRNAQLKPGYNIQFAVEGEYITGVDVSSERSDQLTLIPLMEKQESRGIVYQDVTCDAGYESEENYTWFEGRQTVCYIKPQNYERSKTKKFKSNMALRENMIYDPELDEYTCQNNKKLTARYEGTRKNKSGYESMVTYYECEDCSMCPYKKSCTRAKGNRKIQVSKNFLRQRQESLERITSPIGALLRVNRSIQVEGAFGVVKQDYGFQRFLHRGKKKVFTEILLVAMGYNVNKLHNKIQQNRTRSHLHEKLTA